MKSIECLTTLLNKRLWDILSNLVLNFSIFIKEISMFKNKKKKNLFWKIIFQELRKIFFEFSDILSKNTKKKHFAAFIISVSKYNLSFQKDKFLFYHLCLSVFKNVKKRSVLDFFLGLEILRISYKLRFRGYMDSFFSRYNKLQNDSLFNKFVFIKFKKEMSEKTIFPNNFRNQEFKNIDAVYRNSNNDYLFNMISIENSFKNIENHRLDILVSDFEKCHKKKYYDNVFRISNLSKKNWLLDLNLKRTLVRNTKKVLFIENPSYFFIPKYIQGFLTKGIFLKNFTNEANRILIKNLELKIRYSVIGRSMKLFSSNVVKVVRDSGERILTKTYRNFNRQIIDFKHRKSLEKSLYFDKDYLFIKKHKILKKIKLMIKKTNF
jgi:hypothetical protein